MLELISEIYLEADSKEFNDFEKKKPTEKRYLVSQELHDVNVGEEKKKCTSK